jgi:hypothetical protein
MAFLDNSGDIILDAVLTDTGRLRLARGDGSFKITKFALADDEINYETYNTQHASGSAYFDLEILQTPVFEAFTNNTSTMKSKLISLTNNNLIYLPVLKLNSIDPDTKPTLAAGASGATVFSSGSHVVLVDSDTVTEVNGIADLDTQTGIINGVSATTTGKKIRVDQGLDTTEVSPDFILDPELKETQYIIEIDSRFGKIYDKQTATVATPSFIDDDLVASYYVTQNTGGGFVIDSVTGVTSNSGGGTVNADAEAQNESINGPRGTRLTFGILASVDLVTSDYLFDTIGTDLSRGGSSFAFIDTFIRITGATTGYRVDIPVRFLKLQD